ncbi:MAG TPA: hypothetical protein VFY69_08250 [Solirubrobacterales bacterium]|nr:hypothetical protein [Solirubrobacterales bacterium]
MRLVLPVALLAALALLVGCGDSSEQTTSGPAERGGVEREVRVAFERSGGCKPPRGTSRWGCSVGAYRCQGVVVDRGWSVSCAKPGESIAFLIHRG